MLRYSELTKFEICFQYVFSYEITDNKQRYWRQTFVITLNVTCQTNYNESGGIDKRSNTSGVRKLWFIAAVMLLYITLNALNSTICKPFPCLCYERIFVSPRQTMCPGGTLELPTYIRGFVIWITQSVKQVTRPYGSLDSSEFGYQKIPVTERVRNFSSFKCIYFN